MQQKTLIGSRYRYEKIFAAICAAALLLTGCGGEQVADKPSNNFSGDTVKLGMIAPLNSNEQKFDDIISKVEDKIGLEGEHHTPKFFDNLKSMQMAVEAGHVDEMIVYGTVAKYLMETNDKFEIVHDNAFEKIEYSFCFGVRKDDTALKAELDKVIDEMKSDGTLDKLVDEYITNVKADNIPKVELPTVDGAPTIKVGVTGDLPPLDFVTADNKPAGFNTAMLAEVSKRLNKNIETVQIESGARAAALNSDVVDVIFWTIVPENSDDMPADIDKPEGLELSVPYFKDNVRAHIKLKNK